MATCLFKSSALRTANLTEKWLRKATQLALCVRLKFTANMLLFCSYSACRQCILVWLVCQSILGTANGAASVDQNALIRIATAIPALRNLSGGSWDVNRNPDGCMWAGVSCDYLGQVIKLNLTGYGLVGPVPSSICDFPNLLQIHFPFNNLSRPYTEERFQRSSADM